MAEGVLFNIAEGIIGRLGSQAFQEIGLIWGVKDELEKLQEIVTQVKAVLLDAEQKQANNQVKVWLQSLEDVVYDADDVLDVFYCEAQQRQMVTGNNKISNHVCIFFSSSNQLAFRLKIGHKIKQIKEKLDGIASLRIKFLFEERSEETQLITRGRETYSFVPMDKIIGRDEDKREVIQLLLDPISKENVSTMSVVGFGGLGKTALAQLVFNDEVVQKHFELKLWICVSDVFELSAILKKIIESATNEPAKCLRIDQLQKILREKIDGKRYLLVLEEWLSLKELLMGGAKGSRILITTRSKIVTEVSDTTKPYMLRGLDEKQSWSLFKKMAFKEEKEPENVKIKDIAEEIARKCGGVPLAIRLVGRMLYGKHEESDWLVFKKNKLPKISQKDNKILARLPNWVVKLHNLQTLDLSGCSDLVELPRDLKNMINLWDLMLTSCYRLIHMPCGLGELMCLRTLNRFVLSKRQDKDNAGLGELKKLNELRGGLKIENLRQGKDVSDQ